MFVSPHNFFFLLLNDLHFIFTLLIHVKIHFSFIIINYIIIFIITFILFLSTLLLIGGEFTELIRAAWSTPTHWLLWVSRKVNINHFFLQVILWWPPLQCWHCYIYHMTSFNYDAMEPRDVGLSCGCHLSDSQVVSSV